MLDGGLKNEEKGVGLRGTDQDVDEGAERDGVAGLEEDSGALVDLGVCEVGPRQRQPHLMIQLGEVSDRELEREWQRGRGTVPSVRGGGRFLMSEVPLYGAECGVLGVGCRV